MQDFITLGTAPVDEPCAQLGQDDYYDKVRLECRRFITLGTARMYRPRARLSRC
jgi:hypothetical protein